MAWTRYSVNAGIAIKLCWFYFERDTEKGRKWKYILREGTLDLPRFLLSLSFPLSCIAMLAAPLAPSPTFQPQQELLRWGVLISSLAPTLSLSLSLSLSPPPALRPPHRPLCGVAIASNYTGLRRLLRLKEQCIACQGLDYRGCNYHA